MFSSIFSPQASTTIDIGCLIIIVLAVTSQVTRQDYDVAAKIAKQVPELNSQINGYKGQLEKAEKQQENFAEQGATMRGTIAVLTQQVGELGDQLGSAHEELQELRPGGPVDITLVVDCSGSMEIHHERLKKALASLCKWTVRLSSQTRIGVVGFRDEVVYHYPLTLIDDRGHAKEELLAFIDSMEVKTSAVNHRVAIDKALSMMPDTKSAGEKQVILLLGDCATQEMDGQRGYSKEDLTLARSISADVREWSQTPGREVASVFVGSKTAMPTDFQWFESIAHPRESNFATHSSQLFDVLFRAIDSDEKGKSDE